MEHTNLYHFHETIGGCQTGTKGLIVRNDRLTIGKNCVEIELAVPDSTSAWVLFDRRNRLTAFLARILHQSGLASLRVDLNTEGFQPEPDLSLSRIMQVLPTWLTSRPEYADQPVGLFTGGRDFPVLMRISDGLYPSLKGLVYWGMPNAFKPYKGTPLCIPTLLLVGARERRILRNVRRWMRRHLVGPN